MTKSLFRQFSDEEIDEALDWESLCLAAEAYWDRPEADAVEEYFWDIEVKNLP